MRSGGEGREGHGGEGRRGRERESGGGEWRVGCIFLWVFGSVGTLKCRNRANGWQ